jgi:uncharacterized membrane protein YhfC
MQANVFKKGLRFLLIPFGLGVACFLVSQILLRIPLLNFLQQTTRYQLIAYLHPIPMMLFMALSAGIFEEGFRFLYKSLLLKPKKCHLLEPIVFGIGHALMESCYLLGPALIAGYSLNDLWLGCIERGITIVMHVALTILVWNGFQTGRKVLWLLLAVATHTLVDFILPLLQFAGMGPILLELVYAVFVAISTFLILMLSREFYQKGDMHHEKTMESS